MVTYEDLRDDPSTRAVLNAARAWGVSPRRFLGWEPARTLGFQYEGGRLVKVTVTTEPEWDDESRELALNLEIYERDVCSGCGLPLSETTEADREGLYRPTGAIRCHACTAIQQAAKVYEDSPAPEALRIGVEYHGE